MEILFVIAVGGLTLGVIVFILFIASKSRRPSLDNYVAQLEEENQRLRKLLAQNGISDQSGPQPKKLA